MINIEQIRLKISEAIECSGMTKVAIAKQLNINSTQLSSYINGRKMPSLETLANLCVVLDLDANDILCVTENRK